MTDLADSPPMHTRRVAKPTRLELRDLRKQMTWGQISAETGIAAPSLSAIRRKGVYVHQTTAERVHACWAEHCAPLPRWHPQTVLDYCTDRGLSVKATFTDNDRRALYKNTTISDEAAERMADALSIEPWELFPGWYLEVSR